MSLTGCGTSVPPKGRTVPVLKPVANGQLLFTIYRYLQTIKPCK